MDADCRPMKANDHDSSSAAAFKEWHSVCDALRTGRQSIILRKGGIAEGRDGFSFDRYRRFLLFPTRYHAQYDLVHESSGTAALSEYGLGEMVEIDLIAEVDFTRELRDWESIVRLEPHHIWTREIIRERFEYGENGAISFAMIRVSKLSNPWKFPYEKSFKGCRSWVNLPSVNLDDPFASRPVLEESVFEELKSTIDKLLVIK